MDHIFSASHHTKIQIHHKMLELVHHQFLDYQNIFEVLVVNL